MIKKILRLFKKILSVNEEKIFAKNPKKFWERVAKKHSIVYGLSRHDFEVINKLLALTKAKKILDFGCGSGRLFPVYLQNNAEEIVGIDISEIALKIAQERYPSNKIKTFSKSIFEIEFPEKHFDFINCTRVLQHMNENEIAAVIERLCSLSDHVYINEMSSSDLKTIYFIHKYDYPALFQKQGYHITESGMIDNQKYFLFSKTDSSSN